MIDNEYPWASLERVAQMVPVAAKEGVSDVARAPGEFVSVYRRAGGDPDRVPEAWRKKRHNFLLRHLTQAISRREKLHDPARKTYSRRGLAMLMWAFDPANLGTLGLRTSSDIDEDQVDAANPFAPPERLIALGTSSSKLLRQIVAANPSAPIELLRDLAEEFPEETGKNPALYPFRGTLPGRSPNPVRDEPDPSDDPLFDSYHEGFCASYAPGVTEEVSADFYRQWHDLRLLVPADFDAQKAMMWMRYGGWAAGDKMSRGFRSLWRGTAAVVAEQAIERDTKIIQDRLLREKIRAEVSEAVDYILENPVPGEFNPRDGEIYREAFFWIFDGNPHQELAELLGVKMWTVAKRKDMLTKMVVKLLPEFDQYLRKMGILNERKLTKDVKFQRGVEKARTARWKTEIPDAPGGKKP
jgi:hypothetical protein